MSHFNLSLLGEDGKVHEKRTVTGTELGAAIIEMASGELTQFEVEPARRDGEELPA